MKSSLRVPFIVAALCAAASLPLSAQSDPRLVAAVAQAQQGQGDSARAAVARLLNSTPVSDPLYAEALFTAGRIAGNAIDMEHDMRRVAIEFSSFPWADNALLQLAELGYANGDLPGTERNLERIRSDYPRSDVLAQASLWAARAYFAQSNTAAGCSWLKAGIPAAGTNIELLNQLNFLDGRCRLFDSTATADSTKPNPPAPALADTAKPAPATSAASAWSVQVASFSTDSQARSVADRLAKAGFLPHVVKDADGSFKVRTGRFATKAEAAALARRLKGDFGSPFVVEERP